MPPPRTVLKGMILRRLELDRTRCAQDHRDTDHRQKPRASVRYLRPRPRAHRLLIQFQRWPSGHQVLAEYRSREKPERSVAFSATFAQSDRRLSGLIVTILLAPYLVSRVFRSKSRSDKSSHCGDLAFPNLCLYLGTGIQRRSPGAQPDRVYSKVQNLTSFVMVGGAFASLAGYGLRTRTGTLPRRH
jgi:hypothetical protein